eukprot:6376363-Prymnesium_polylepis.1
MNKCLTDDGTRTVRPCRCSAVVSKVSTTLASPTTPRCPRPPRPPHGEPHGDFVMSLLLNDVEAGQNYLVFLKARALTPVFYYTAAVQV